MELRQLRYFVALAEEQNFTRAASKVHITQSTLSHQIGQLEVELGHRLFDRLGRRVVITEAGTTLLLNATRALREVDESLRLLKDAPHPLVGTLRIGATHTFILKLIPECLAQFLRRHPSVSVQVREAFSRDVAHLVETEAIDLGIALEPPPRETLDFVPLYVDEMVLAVAHDHPFAVRKRIRMVELHKQRMILPTAISATRELIDHALRSVAAEPFVVAEIDAVAATIELVTRTDLGAIISRLAAGGRDDLRIIALESPVPIRRPGVLFKRDRPQSSAVRSFFGILRRTILQNAHLHT